MSLTTVIPDKARITFDEDGNLHGVEWWIGNAYYVIKAAPTEFDKDVLAEIRRAEYEDGDGNSTDQHFGPFPHEGSREDCKVCNPAEDVG